MKHQLNEIKQTFYKTKRNISMNIMETHTTHTQQQNKLNKPNQTRDKTKPNEQNIARWNTTKHQRHKEHTLTKNHT